MDAQDSYDAYLRWLHQAPEMHRSRALALAASRKLFAIARRLADEQQLPEALPQSLRWLEDNRQALFAALVNSGLTTSTAAAYLSRHRTAVRAYQQPQPQPSHPFVPLAPLAPLPLTPLQQLAEFLHLSDRWPDLLPHFRQPLIDASHDLLGPAPTEPP